MRLTIGGFEMRTILYYAATAGYDKKEQDRRLASMAPFIPDGYRVVFSIEREGPEFLDRAEDFSRAVDALKASIQRIGPEDCDALIAGGALDPGVPAARELARVPVIAPGEASLYIAFLTGLPLSIVTVDEHAVAAAQKFVEAARLKPEVVSIRSMDTPVRKIVANIDEGRTALVREATAAVNDDGARAIYLGSMTLPTLGLAAKLRDDLQVPVFDPLRIAIRMAVEVIASKPGD